MFDIIINRLSPDERELFRTLFMQPVFHRVINEQLEKLEAQIWSLDIKMQESDFNSADFYAEYKIMKTEYLLWKGLKNLIDNVEGNENANRIQVLG